MLQKAPKKGPSLLNKLGVPAVVVALSSLAAMFQDKVSSLVHRLDMQTIEGSDQIAEEARRESIWQNSRIELRQLLSQGEFNEYQTKFPALCEHALTGDQVKYADMTLSTPVPNSQNAIKMLCNLLKEYGPFSEPRDIAQCLEDLTKRNLLIIQTLPIPTLAHAAESSQIGSDENAPVLAVSPSAFLAIMDDMRIPARQSGKNVIFFSDGSGITIESNGTATYIPPNDQNPSSQGNVVDWRNLQFEELSQSQLLHPSIQHPNSRSLSERRKSTLNTLRNTRHTLITRTE